MAPGSLGVVLDRRPPACPAGLAPGHRGRRDRHRGGPRGQATPAAFFERCQPVHWRFFANRSDAFVAQGLPQATSGYAAPLPPLRERFSEVWLVDGSRLAAVAHRRKLLREVRARVRPGSVTACDDLYHGIPRPLAFHPDAAAGARPGATAALAPVAPGPLLVGERLDGVGAFWATWTSRGLAGRRS